MNLSKVLVADAVDEACVRLLRENGIDVVCKYKLSNDLLMKEIRNYDGLIVRSDTKVTADVIEAGEKLKVIGRAGAGTDNIDIKAATAKNIVVLNAPSGNSISACELTCALITCLARNIVAAAESLKAGRWDRKLYSGHELCGKTLAIIGLGRIGKEVAIRMQSWGMKTIGFDPIVTAAEAETFKVEHLPLEEIWPQADYITVHTPLIPQTKNLINKNVFNACKKGIRVVNVARGGIINEEDLLSALIEGLCKGAALDVYQHEPPTSDTILEIIRHPNVIATPHLGASTAEAQTRVAVEVAEQFVALTDRSKNSATILSVVNPTTLKSIDK